MTPNPATAVLDVRRRRLLFRATHRGTHENDLMLGGFVRGRIAQFNEAELEAVEAILEIPDVDLADWLSGRRAVPEGAGSPMLQAMCQAVHAREVGF